jgi:hypothetical protein
MYLLFSALLLALMIGALADIITADQSRIRHLDKIFWVIIVILIPLVGSILWFTVGREYQEPVDRGTLGDPRRWAAPEHAESVSQHVDTASQLAALEREIAASEKEEEIRRLEAQLRARREGRSPEH